MMANCPKCGFYQPKDQYCANCGVDMLAFRPETPSLSNRFLKSTWVQLSVLIVVIVGVFSFIRLQQKNNLAQRFAELDALSKPAATSNQEPPALDASSPANSLANSAASESAQPTQETAAVKDTPASNHEATTESLSLASSAAPAAAAPAASDTTQPDEPATAADAATGTSASANVTQGPTSFRVLFAEVPRSLFDDVFKAQAFGVLPEARLKQVLSANGWQQVETSEQLPLKTDQPTALLRRTRDRVTGQDVGFAFEMTPVTQDENGLHLQVDALRTLRAPGAPTIEEVPLPAPDAFVIPKNGAAFLAGVLPHRTLTEDEERFYRTVNVLRVLASENFKSGNTEFVILIEPK